MTCLTFDTQVHSHHEFKKISDGIQVPRKSEGLFVVKLLFNENPCVIPRQIGMVNIV